MTQEELDNLKVGDIVEVVSVQPKWVRDRRRREEQGIEVIGRCYNLSREEVRYLKDKSEVCLGDNETRIVESHGVKIIGRRYRVDEDMLRQLYNRSSLGFFLGNNETEINYFLENLKVLSQKEIITEQIKEEVYGL